MARYGLLLSVTIALFGGACSSSSTQGSPDGGALDPDGGTRTGDARCDIGGYPCAPGDQTAAALELSEQYKGEIQERRSDGESYRAIADWLRDQDDVADVVVADDRLRFRVEGGSAQWMYTIGSEYPRISLRSDEDTAAASSEGGFVQKRVLREDGSDTELKKKALVLEPFHFQLESDTTRWLSELGALHDYDVVDYFKNDEIRDEYFTNWNDYRFVWVLSHGAYLPDREDPEYTAIFSAKECGLSVWITQEIAAGRGSERTVENETLASLDGLPIKDVEAQLLPDQLGRWRTFRNKEQETLKRKGKGCGMLEMDDVVLREPSAQGRTIRAPAYLHYIYYDQDWYGDHFKGGLDNVLLYLSVCSSQAVPIDLAPGKPGAIFGWTFPIDSEQDDLATGVLFKWLIEQGATAGYAFEKLKESPHAKHTFEGKETQLELSSETESAGYRVRENISIVDAVSGLPFPDEGGQLEAFEITSDNKTRVDVHLIVEGFGKDPPDEFKVQIFDESDSPLSQAVKVPDPVNPSNPETFMTVQIELDKKVTVPSELEVEARVTLPEDTSPQRYGRHRVKLTVLPVAEEQWRLTVPGVGTMKGPVVSAPSVVGIPTEEGLAWQLLLTQEPPAVIPSASLTILNHNGRRMDCTGETGNFAGGLGFVYSEEMGAPTYAGDGDEIEGCQSDVDVDVQTFSRDDDMNIALSGTLCKLEEDPFGEGVLATPVSFTGRVRWPRAGCGMMPPVNRLLGSYVSSENLFLCIDVYDNSIFARPVMMEMTQFDLLCTQPGVTCSEEICAENDLGRCDYRGDSSQVGFRGTVQHYRIGGDWPSLQDLQTTCTALGGIWTSPL